MPGQVLISIFSDVKSWDSKIPNFMDDFECLGFFLSGQMLLWCWTAGGASQNWVGKKAADSFSVEKNM